MVLIFCFDVFIDPNGLYFEWNFKLFLVFSNGIVRGFGRKNIGDGKYKIRKICNRKTYEIFKQPTFS